MAATKTAKARNPDRKSGKAWSKSHGVVQVKSAPSAEKVAARTKVISHGGGSPITLPNITWDGAARTMALRWPNTRKVRTLDAWLAYNRGGRQDDGVPVVIENNPEVKIRTPRKQPVDRKNGR